MALRASSRRVAGGGTSSADLIPATSAQLFSPRGLATDRAGNLLIAEIGSSVIHAVRLADPSTLDPQSPTTTAGSSPAAVSGWNNTAVQVTLTAVDNPGGCGVASIHYSIDGGAETVVPGNTVTIDVTAEGVTTL